MLVPVVLISRSLPGLTVLIPTRPLESMRNLSLPAVSTVTVSAAGNLILVSVSPI